MFAIESIGTKPANRIPATVYRDFELLLNDVQGGQDQSDFIRKIYDSQREFTKSTVISLHELNDVISRSSSLSIWNPRHLNNRKGPGTDVRLGLYQREYLALGKSAIEEALSEAQVLASSIAHVIFVTCTGSFARMTDLLKEEVGISSNARVYNLLMHGCHGFFPALDIADALLCNSSVSDTYVLIVCIELCSLHWSFANTRSAIVGNSLFADGAVAVLCGKKMTNKYHVKFGEHDEGRFHDVIPNSKEMITWNPGTNGYDAYLDKTLPKKLESFAGEHLRKWLEVPTGWRSRRKNPHVALHPGGGKILALLPKALGIEPDQIADSLWVYQNLGNMSSATVPFIIKRIMERQKGADITAIGFGPGVTVEGIEIRKLSS